MFARASEPDAYKKGIEQRFGDFAEKILKAFPGDTQEQTATSSADIFTSTAFAWPSWTWARLQSRTGKSKIYMYYFNQQQTKLPFMSVAPRGAQHAAEIKYVLKTIDPKTGSEEDLKLSEIMANYWTNFAKSGDPNGNDLPVWPEFKEMNSSVMYLSYPPKSGPVPNPDKLELMEQYFKYRRESK
jgi:para-nitrobenzyl esterase